MKPSSQKRRPSGGFALVATILLMVLLAMVVIGTLSLSTVSMRSSNQDASMAIARANARMALMIAIGELQQHAGPDTRVTASADILDPANPSPLGVWKSKRRSKVGI